MWMSVERGSSLEPARTMGARWRGHLPWLASLAFALNLGAQANAALVAEYRFEETAYSGAAGEAVDTSGNNRSGRVIGSASSTSGGKSCRGLSTPIEYGSGSNALDTGLDVNTELGNSGSISFWYYSNSQEYSNRVLFDATTSSGARFMLHRDDNSLIAGNPDVDITFTATDSGGSHRTTTDANVFADYYWTHITISWHFASGSSASRQRIYINGSLTSNRNFTSSGALNSGIGTLYMGDNRSTASSYVLSAGGVIDGVRVYSHELSGAEVAAAYALNPPCTYLHHLRLETASASALSGAIVPFTVRACANASCSSTWTGGVTGTLNLSGTGVVAAFPSGSGFSIPAGSSSTTVNAIVTSLGVATASLSELSSTPAGSPKVQCGLGTTPGPLNNCDLTIAGGLHHVRVASTATGLSCSPNSYTLTACANADCSTRYTSGLSGNLSISGGSVAYPAGSAFTMLAGSSTAEVKAQLTQAATYTVGVSGLSVAPTASPGLQCGMGATPSAGGSCQQVIADAGFLLDVPHHVAGDSQSVSISAVRKSDNSLSCTPAFANVSRSINFRCTHNNPSSGFVPVVVAGAALNAANNAAAACDGVGRNVSLAFNGSGVATTTVSHADVGLLGLTATYTGSGADAGLTLTGSDTFVAAPAAFVFSGVTAGPIKAGADFSATVTAVNRSGVKVSNFGRESPAATATLTFAKRRPTGAGSQAGVFSGSLGAFLEGQAQASNLRWSEVGDADLVASSTAYLASGLSISGTTGSGPVGAVGPFVPNHFEVAVTQACASGGYTYSGEPFALTVTARNAAGGITQNHDGGALTSPNFARAVTLSAATNGGLGALAQTSLPASAFAAGTATLNNQTFGFTNKLTAPAAVAIRAVNADGVSSAGQAEGAANLRSGRLRLSNAFGSELKVLKVPVTVQFWSGAAWVQNTADACTVVPASSVVRARYLNHQGAITTAWGTAVQGDVNLAGGRGDLILSAPSNGGTGSVDLAVNLGASTTDQSCLSAHPASVGAQKPWLRALNGSCATTHDRDPSARATFGVFHPESQKVIHSRDLH